MNITKEDKQTVTDIITQSMGNLPGIKWIVGNNPRTTHKRLRVLADFVFETAFSRNGIFLSSDRKGVAVFFKPEIKKTFRDYWNQFRFAVRCTGIFHAYEIYRHESYIVKQRPNPGTYLYFWIFGVLPDARGFGAATQLKDIILSESQKQQLPIYLETTNPQNRRVYERYGFKVYHEWFVPGRNFTFWFMKRDISISKNINP
ncbi:MAG: GNAT family N-acetyltransferase [Bacteroidetes bacterium]|nr:MAG: GNAT family N-acetyltransferase [Bacteroidota bacterium]